MLVLTKKNRDGSIGMCAAMILNFRNNRMSLIHKIVGLILYSGCSGKEVPKNNECCLTNYMYALKVFQRLKNLYMTVTHKTTITCINQLGNDFDQAVKNWRDIFLPSLHLNLAEVNALITQYNIYGENYACKLMAFCTEYT